MGCSSCGASRAYISNNAGKMVSSQYRVKETGPCNYNDEILADYRKKLNWFRDTGKYMQHGVRAAQMNKYLGIVISSSNVHDKCYWKKDLDVIADIIELIIALQNE